MSFFSNSAYAYEVSRIVDVQMKLTSELVMFEPCSEHIYTGPCVFFTTQDGAEFFEHGGVDYNDARHADGIFGWNQRLPHVANVIPLGCRHIECLSHHESILQITSALKSLHDAYSEGFAHLSRHASSLAVPQEDSMCGDGPSVHDTPVARCPDAPIESTAPL